METDADLQKNDPCKDDNTTWMGFANATFTDMKFLQAGDFCKTVIAQGTGTFIGRRNPDNRAKVDKTFVYVHPKKKNHPLGAIIRAHHSSLNHEEEPPPWSD